jgi:hypothetical protein
MREFPVLYVSRDGSPPVFHSDDRIDLLRHSSSVLDACEGEKNTRRGVELCFEKFFNSPKLKHTDQKQIEITSEVIFKI